MKREKGEHYVNNKEFSLAVVGFVNSTHEARAEEKPEPQIDDYIGTCFLKISEGLSRKPNFSCYTYREEMVSDAIENCVKAIMNYDITKATRTGNPNAFSYFTQICYFAFLRRIQKEKKHQDIKALYIERAGIEAFADFNDADMGLSIVEKVRVRSDIIRRRDEKIKQLGKLTRTRKSKVSVASLEKFFI
jgi:hypothetical protein|tara:strand:- start:3192 stop:3761 length:570 start_codon:yes stop_codon:yes gene_type:complete